MYNWPRGMHISNDTALNHPHRDLHPRKIRPDIPPFLQATLVNRNFCHPTKQELQFVNICPFKIYTLSTNFLG